MSLLASKKLYIGITILVIISIIPLTYVLVKVKRCVFMPKHKTVNLKLLNKDDDLVTNKINLNNNEKKVTISENNKADNNINKKNESMNANLNTPSSYVNDYEFDSNVGSQMKPPNMDEKEPHTTKLNYTPDINTYESSDNNKIISESSTIKNDENASCETNSFNLKNDNKKPNTSLDNNLTYQLDTISETKNKNSIPSIHAMAKQVYDVFFNKEKNNLISQINSENSKPDNKNDKNNLEIQKDDKKECENNEIKLGDKFHKEITKNHQLSVTHNEQEKERDDLLNEMDRFARFKYQLMNEDIDMDTNKEPVNETFCPDIIKQTEGKEEPADQCYYSRQKASVKLCNINVQKFLADLKLQKENCSSLHDNLIGLKKGNTENN